MVALFFTPIHFINMHTSKVKGYILAIISSASFGLIPAFILPVKQVSFSMDVTLFYRFFFSAIMLLGILFFRKENWRIKIREVGILCILGLLYALSTELLFVGYDYLSAGIASTIFFVYPMLVAIIMFFMYEEKLSGKGILSLVLATLGVMVLSFNEGSFTFNFKGLGIVLLAALSYGLYIIIVNKARLKVSGFKLTFYSMFFTSLYYLIKAFIWGESLILPKTEMYFNFALFAFVTTVVSGLSLVYAIKHIGSTPTAILGALEPIVAVLVSVISFGEHFSFNLAIGIVLIIVGVVLNILSAKSTHH